MIEDLTELNTFDEVIEFVSGNMNLPKEMEKNLKKWANSSHFLKEGVRSTFKKTFEMKPSNALLSELRLGQRVGERTKLKKIKNLIIGWLAEEIASEVFRNNKYVKSIEPSGIDVDRTVEIRINPTDPDYRIQLKNGRVLFLEVASIGKHGDGVIRLKYNKVQRNLMRFFGLTRGHSAHWIEHFLNPCAYLCTDLISKNTGNFIIEGSSFYVNQSPTPYEGWENQEVVVFDAQNRLTLNGLMNLDLQSLRERIVKDVNSEFNRVSEAVGVIGNPLLITGNEGPPIRKFLKKMFELDHMISLAKRRNEKEKEQAKEMERELLALLEEIPTQNRGKLRLLMSKGKK
jgi:hypothetical protein